MQLLSAVIIVSCLSLLCQASLSSPHVQQVTPKPTTTGENEDPIEYEDFEDEDDEGVFDDLITPSVDSLTHIHRKNGEILVPCFGMWWPVGGSRPAPPPVYYDYGEEYYDDYGRRRRRAKKRRAKKAKMRKKKKAKV